MTEELQQLRGKSLSNEHHGGGAAQALSLTNARSRPFVHQNGYLGICMTLLSLFTEGREDCLCLLGWGAAESEQMSGAFESLDFR